MGIDNELILKFQQCQTTPQEEALLMDYLAESEEHRRQFDRANMLFCASVLHGRPKKKARFPLWARIAAAIAILIIGGTSYHLFFKNDIAPTEVTLAEVIIEAPVGSLSRVELPDESIVWLQSGSRLSYAASYDRSVSLEGEAYFDIQKNTDHPFIVRTSDVNIKVTGTVFNLRAYPNENTIETTLACGRVSLEDQRGEVIFHLRPGQQVAYSRSDKSTDAKPVDAWSILLDRYGVITIPDASLTEICSVLENVYEVSIRTIGDDGMPVTFSFAKESTVEEIISRLENISGKKFTVN